MTTCVTLCSVFLCFILSLASCASLPKGTMGFYCLLADDTVSGYTSSDDWQPSLYDYQLQGSNVLWLTFINPQTMQVPPAFSNLALCRNQTGCPSSSQRVIFSIGGEAYSNQVWSWLKTQSAAYSMAQNVAQWPAKYGCDGIDLDIEGPAGSDQTSAENIVYFVQQLRSLNPNILVTVPVYGFPQIAAENNLVNAGWTQSGQSTGLIDSIGIMVYDDLGSLQYVKDYANATSQWYGFPIHVNVPTQSIIVGLQGTASSSTITQLAQNVVDEQLGGIMVWFASVYDATHNRAAFTYGGDDASSTQSQTGSAWSSALAMMN